MSGIYIHIPFCKQKCSYCDFHFSTNKRLESEMVGAICQELINKSHLFQEVSIQTIYFGGGSPSFIQTENLARILDQIRENYSLEEPLEVTIECNPDDINQNFSDAIMEMGFNRISLGIQSFFNEDLELMNRAHDSDQAASAVQQLKKSGFQNITIDLIYGLPNTSMEKWKANIQQALNLDVPHISSYCLTIEEKTLLHHQIETGAIQLPTPESQLEQFVFLSETLVKEGYEHYEISNFAKPGFESKHNSSYWKNKDYIGVGPSAHSKIGNKRFWNISNNYQYIKRLKTDLNVSEEEILSEKDLFNEMLMIGLRTKWGVKLDNIRSSEFYTTEFQKELNKKIEEGFLQIEDEAIKISGVNKFIADTIISDLFIV